MNKKTVIVALLDKAWPPQHSFVDGMLTDVVAKEPDIKMRLYVSRSNDDDLYPRNYRGAACIPVLYPRRGVGRLKNFLVTLKNIKYLAQREKQRGNRVVLFVRNDPIFLLASTIMRKHVDKLVFQSSFPHEESSNDVIKRKVAKLLYRLAGHGVDVVTGVSPQGVARARRLCPSAKEGSHIPLLSDFPVVEKDEVRDIDTNKGPVFIYIGTHAKGRDLETVLEGIVKAVSYGAVAQFRFVGVLQEDEERLLKVQGLDMLIKKGLFKFERPITRDKVFSILMECDIGISLIPPKPIYYESSPTKLAEYMGAGLAVLANRGIPMQEKFIHDSSGGVLVDWRSDSIAEKIIYLASSAEDVMKYKINSVIYAKTSLRYSKYINDFRSLIGSSES